MEEDIKILEEIIEYCKEHLPPYYKDRDLQALENLIKGYRELEEQNDALFELCHERFEEIVELEVKYEKLSKVAIETTFDGSNNDTEFLARTLLKQGKILFNNESKMYINPHTDEEFEVYGMMFEKEKCYLLDDDKLDDYTKQLEYQLKNSIPKSKIKEIVDRNLRQNALVGCKGYCYGFNECQQLAKEIVELMEG